MGSRYIGTSVPYNYLSICICMVEKKSLPLRKKNRLEKWFYRSGMFYVTINVHHHTCVFWEVINDEMKLNIRGKIVEDCLYRLPQQYSYVSLCGFVIMPNHIHVVLDIDHVVRDARERPLHHQKKKSLSSLIWAFKTVSTKQLRLSWFPDFQRQRSFYDHVIRNEADLQRIQEYIELNPYKRENDEYYLG